MMKKIILFVLCLSSILITGCEKKTNEENNTVDNNVIVKDGDTEIKFNKTKKIGDMEFIYPDGSSINEAGDTIYISFGLNKDTDDEKNISSIIISELKNISIEDAMKESSATNKENVTINDINWTKYITSTETSTINTYLYTHNENTYAIDVIMNESVESFEESFMKNIKFN